MVEGQAVCLRDAGSLLMVGNELPDRGYGSDLPWNRGRCVSLERRVFHASALGPQSGRFYDFLESYWQNLRMTNPIESTFATIRLRTAKTRNCLSEKTALPLVHQLAMSAQKRWRRLRGFRHLADVIADVRFTDGVKEKETGGSAAGFRTAIHQI